MLKVIYIIFQKLTIPKEEVVYFKLFQLKQYVKGSNIHKYMISSMDINIKQSICRHHMAPRVHLSYEKQLTTERFLLGFFFFFFWKICKFLNLSVQNFSAKKGCIVQSLKNKYNCYKEPKKVRKMTKKQVHSHCIF